MKILIADDHPVFRGGLKFLLESSFKDITVFSVENGEQALHAVNTIEPDVVFLDIDMPVINGLDACYEITTKKPGLAVIILSIHESKDIIKLAFTKGASGYLIKDNTAEEIVECLNVVLSGRRYLPLLFSSEKEKKSIEEDATIKEGIYSLTNTELKVLKLVSQKYSSKEIANLLFVSPKSIDNYRSRICKKLNLDARNNSLLLWVLENKYLLDIDE